jgi:hypothetical protein
MIRILTFPFRLVWWVAALPFRLVFFLVKVVLKTAWLIPKTVFKVAWFVPKTALRSVRALGVAGLTALAFGIGLGFLIGSRRSSSA